MDIKLLFICNLLLHLPLITFPIFRRIYCYFKRYLNNFNQCYFMNWCDKCDTCYFNSKTFVDISGYRSRSHDKLSFITSFCMFFYCIINTVFAVVIYFWL